MNVGPVNPYSGIQYPQFNWNTSTSTPMNQQVYVQNIPSVNGIEAAKQLPVGKNASRRCFRIDLKISRLRTWLFRMPLIMLSRLRIFLGLLVDSLLGLVLGLRQLVHRHE